MKTELCDTCIYAIAHGEKLRKAAASAKPTAFREKKSWVTGHRLWREAGTSGMDFPIIFADARDCSRLVYWGVLRKVTLDDSGTDYVVERMRKLKGGHSPQELFLRKTGKTIAPDFIRSYAIYRTPVFISAGIGASRTASALF